MHRMLHDHTTSPASGRLYTQGCRSCATMMQCLGRNLSRIAAQVNHSPSFSTEMAVDRQVKEQLLKDTLLMASALLLALHFWHSYDRARTSHVLSSVMHTPCAEAVLKQQKHGLKVLCYAPCRCSQNLHLMQHRPVPRLPALSRPAPLRTRPTALSLPLQPTASYVPGMSCPDRLQSTASWQYHARSYALAIGMPMP